MSAGRARKAGGQAYLALASVFAGAIACSPGRSHRDGDLSRGAGGSAAPPRAAVTASSAGGGAPPPRANGDANERGRKAQAAPAPEATAPADLVTIHVLVEPPQRAHVIWGAKDFGLGPLDIRRPRGSGPLDLLVRAPGYLTLHTRAFTDRDNTLSVHLVPEAEATRFPGYQAPSPTVTAHGTTAATPQRSTTRAMRPGRSSDGSGAP